MKEEIRGILIKVCGEGADADGLDLIESGLMDSLAIIELLNELEDIGIEIQPTEVDRNAFATFSGILAIAESARDRGRTT